jgi:DNA-binding response OmpR family regulator
LPTSTLTATRPRLLLIEDDPPIVRFASAAFRMEGMTVQTASTGRAGLAAARSDPPDLILLDLSLPEMHGLDVLDQLRAGTDTNTIPVVILTASGGVDAERRAQALGVSAYLHKPIAAGALVAAVRLALDAR